MPKKVLPTPEEFDQFEREMLSRDFRLVTYADIKRDNLWHRVHRKGPGESEVGFIYPVKSGLTVYVWTTWLREKESVRDMDAGWVLITEGSKILHPGRPIHRTKNFLNKLLERARINKWRINHIPLCKTCHMPMRLVHGQVIKSRFWECRRFGQHGPDFRRRTLSLNDGMPESTRKRLEKDSRIRAKKRGEYELEQLALGKVPKRAVFLRGTNK